MGAVRLGLPSVDLLVPNDDLSSDEVSLPFTFLGALNSCWVNNNGSISFDGPEYTYTPRHFELDVTGRGDGIGACVAPFWGDVDTRGDSGDYVVYGATEVDGRTAFVATWYRVGYYDRRTDLLNTFQVVLYERGFEFNYDQIQWDLGTASYADDPDTALLSSYWLARAGFYLPRLEHYSDVGHPVPARSDLPDNIGSRLGVTLVDSAYELPGSGGSIGYYPGYPGGGNGSLRDGEAHALISGRRNSSVNGRYVFGAIAPPLRQWPRDDGLRRNPARSSPTSRQGSLRRGPRGNYL